LECLEWTTAHATRLFLGAAVLVGIDATRLFACSLLPETHSNLTLDEKKSLSNHLPTIDNISAQKLAQSVVSSSEANCDTLVIMNPILVTFLVVLGSGAAVLLGYAVSYLFLTKAGMSEHDKVRLEVAAGQDFSQPVYMAQVRDRNLRDMMPPTR
jgi:hypothetical protein